MRHQLDRAIATDLSYETLQMRRRRFELALPEPDNRCRNLYPITVGCERHAFVADRESIPDSFQGEGLSGDLTLGHYRARRER